MSVIIKGMKLPEKSEHREYTISIVQDCPAAIMLLRTKTKPSEFFKCAEIPTPHGRLIDADYLIKVLQDTLDNYPDNYNDGKTIEKLVAETCKQFIDHCPTIIEAEVSE